MGLPASPYLFISSSRRVAFHSVIPLHSWLARTRLTIFVYLFFIYLLASALRLVVVHPLIQFPAWSVLTFTAAFMGYPSLLHQFSGSPRLLPSYSISSMTCPRMQLSLLIFTSFSLLSSLLCHFVFLRSPLIGCLPKGIHHLSRLDLVVLTGGLMRLTVQPIRRLLHAPAVYLSVWLFIRLPLSVCLPVHLVLCVSVFTCLCLFHSTFHGEFSGQSKLSHGEQILSWSYLTFLRSCFFIFFFYPHHIIFLSRRGVLVWYYWFACDLDLAC